MGHLGLLRSPYLLPSFSQNFISCPPWLTEVVQPLSESYSTYLSVASLPVVSADLEGSIRESLWDAYGMLMGCLWATYGMLMGHLGVLVCFSYFLHFHFSALLGLPKW
jgi:hypothetical protein